MANEIYNEATAKRKDISMEKNHVVIREEDIRSFVQSLQENGKSRKTQQIYQRILCELYAWLPEDKQLGKAEMEAFLEEKRSQTGVGTINHAITAFNGLVRYLGRHEMCLKQRQKEGGTNAELTRDEYLRLLTAGRRLRERDGYVLTKLFANTPLRVQELERITVEAAKAGFVHNSDGARISLPMPLCRELLDYAEMEGITGGAIFRTRSGIPFNRTTVFQKISQLGEAAKVPSNKVNPRSLRRLHFQIMQELQTEYEPMIVRSYERQMEAEQRLIGWTDGISASHLAGR